VLAKTKPYIIPKWQVMRAFELVKANAGAAGVDQQSIQDFEGNLKDNLYKLWNRLSSGSNTKERRWGAYFGCTNGQRPHCTNGGETRI
jgi:hypothetical protein